MMPYPESLASSPCWGYMPSFLREGLIAMLDVYMDESEGGDVTTVAGFAASADNWAVFMKRWSTILEEDGMGPTPFHAVNFARRSATAYRHMSAHQKLDHMEKLCRAIGEHLSFGFAARIHQSDFKRIAPQWFVAKYGSAYAMCYWASIVDVLGPYLRKNSLESEQVSIVMEDGHRNRPNAQQRLALFKSMTGPVDVSGCERLIGFATEAKNTVPRIGTVTIATKIDKPTGYGLQAADLLAYCLTKIYRYKQDTLWNWAGGIIADKIPIFGSNLGERYITEHIDVMQKVEASRRFNKAYQYRARRFPDQPACEAIVSPAAMVTAPFRPTYQAGEAARTDRTLPPNTWILRARWGTLYSVSLATYGN